MNGVYSFVYSSVAGVGLGIFEVKNGELTGADLAGGRYRGHAVENPKNKEINLSFEMTVPQGVMLVQGTSPQDLPYTKQGAICVPADFNDGKPFDVFIAPGMITMMVRRIPNDYGAYASGISFKIEPITARH